MTGSQQSLTRSRKLSTSCVSTSLFHWLSQNGWNDFSFLIKHTFIYLRLRWWEGLCFMQKSSSIKIPIHFGVRKCIATRRTKWPVSPPELNDFVAISRANFKVYIWRFMAFQIIWQLVAHFAEHWIISRTSR